LLLDFVSVKTVTSSDSDRIKPDGQYC